MRKRGAGDTVAVGDGKPNFWRGTRIVVYGMNHAPEIAGVGRYTGQIVDHLSAAGAEVTIVTTPPHYPGWAVQTPFRNRFATEATGRLRVYRCPLLLRRRMGGIWRLLAPLSFALSSAPIAFWQILRRRPNAVLVVEPTLFVAPLALAAARLAGARRVLHIQDLEIDAAFAMGHLAGRGWLKRLAAGFEHFVLKRFDRIITISDRMAESIAAKHVNGDRITIVRNWVDTKDIHPLAGPSPYRRELGLRDDEIVILYSGNVGPKQGLALLVRAARRLREEPRFRFVIAGQGPARDALMAEAADLPAVLFLPFQPEERFNAFLNLADIHVLPQEEGAADLVLPSKLGGLLATGKPLIVTAAVGTELAGFLEGSATLTPPGDTQALADAIRTVATTLGAADPQRDTRLTLAGRLDKSAALEAFVAALLGPERPG